MERVLLVELDIINETLSLIKIEYDRILKELTLWENIFLDLEAYHRRGELSRNISDSKIQLIYWDERRHEEYMKLLSASEKYSVEIKNSKLQELKTKDNVEFN